MLDVQKRLRDYSGVFSLQVVLDDLLNNYGISSRQSEIYPELYLFQYLQTQSPFREKIVRECRGLILNSQDNWNVVCYPFDKFFNLGEQPEFQKDFNWNNYRVFNKLDGSLICLWYYADKWNVSTSRHPDALGDTNIEGVSFKEAVQVSLDWLLHLNSFNESCTYMYEFISEYNKNVVDYGEDYYGLHLLGIRDNISLKELPVLRLEVSEGNTVVTESDNMSQNFCENIGDMKYWFCIDKPNSQIWKNVDELNPLRGGEGYILVDDSFNRIKVKSKAYVAIHHLKHSWSLTKAIEIVLKGEVYEVSLYLREYREELLNIEFWLKSSISRLESLWSFIDSNRDIYKSRKDIAIELRGYGYPFINAIFAKEDGKSIKDYVYSMSVNTIKKVYKEHNQ